MKHLDKHLKHIQEFEPVTMAFLSIIGLTLTATRLYKDFFTQAALRCRDLSSNEKDLCLLQSKIFALKKKSTSLTTGLSKCSKTKNPSDCITKLKGKIQDTNLLIKTFKKRHAKLSQVNK